MKKEILTIEFRYRDKSTGDHDGGHRTKTVTIGIYDTLEEAIEAGNKALSVLAQRFQVRHDDRFKMKHIFGNPQRLVTNCCYPTNGIQYFAKIEKLDFADLGGTINETFAAFERYKKWKED